MLNKNVVNLFKKIKFIVFDFDGVFTDNKVIVNEKGLESVICDRSDGLGLSKLKAIGVEGLILSTEVNDVVGLRAKKLKIRCIYGCKDKLNVLRKELKKRGISLGETAYVANDINDLECLKAVGFPIIVKNSHKDINQYGKYKTKLKGGEGAVREICDLICAARKGDKRNA